MLILYSTLGCHLCDIAEQNLLAAGLRKEEIELVDIADDTVLLKKYARIIPVVKDKTSQKEIAWPFSAHDVVEWWNRLDQ